MTFSNHTSFDYHTPSDQWPTFAEWCAAQTGFARFDRDDTEQDVFIVVPYTFCPNMATLLDESNHQALLAALEAADKTPAEGCSESDYIVRSHSHWATPYDMILVRAGSPAFDAADQCIAALADYPVLDDCDYSEREHEAGYANVLDAIRSLTFECQGAEIDAGDVAADLHHWYCNHGNWGFLESPENRSVRDSERDQGLEALGWTLHEDDVYRWLQVPQVV